ncbi:MAG: hypothetical protein AAGF77_06335 [Bacteroidota bacterium]
MRKSTLVLLFLGLVLGHPILAQEDTPEANIKVLEQQKKETTQQEKEALKEEVQRINKQLSKGEITVEEAQQRKEEAAKRHALNIENRLAILDNQIALIERNEVLPMPITEPDSTAGFQIGINAYDGRERLFGFRFREKEHDKKVKYDRRTYSDLFLAIGFNNAIIEGQSLNDSPYKMGGSRFFEIGWQWRTRVFQNTNWLRLNYGFAFQFNGLKPDNNQYFVQDGNQVELATFDVELEKSKLRTDNLVFPLHFEIGPSKRYESKQKMRYSIRKQFRWGLGGYGGFNIGTRQKLEYTRNGDTVKDKLKRDYNTSNLIYGLSTYIGFNNGLLYLKYDLNPIFQDALVEQRNISLGLRYEIR